MKIPTADSWDLLDLPPALPWLKRFSRARRRRTQQQSRALRASHRVPCVHHIACVKFFEASRMGSLFSRPASVFAQLFAAYQSFKALETSSVDDDKQWLTFCAHTA